jgi:hypothetical protein
MTTTWSLNWSHGSITIHSGAAAIGHTRLRLDDGRWAEPFHEAPWITAGETVEPGLGNLRGDWPCLPFGRVYGRDDSLVEPWAALVGTEISEAAAPLAQSDKLLHGYSANADWELLSQGADELLLGLEYPSDSPIERLTRSIRPLAGQAGLDVSVSIHVRRPCRRPFGFHPNFSLRGAPSSFQIKPGRYKFGLTHPALESLARARPNSRFESLDEIPLKDGSIGNLSRLPFADDCEDILQLCGIEEGVHLLDHHEKVAWDLNWDTTLLPSCLLWMSNRGRKFPPWNGRNLCVGVEPVASAFDLGSEIANSDNPIARDGVATSITLEPGVPFSVGYRIRGQALA